VGGRLDPTIGGIRRSLASHCTLSDAYREAVDDLEKVHEVPEICVWFNNFAMYKITSSKQQNTNNVALFICRH